MGRSPSLETKSDSATQEIPRMLWNPQAYDRGHKPHPSHPISLRSIFA
jgi:hypothetical protein